MEDMELEVEPSEEGLSATCPCCGEKISISLAKSEGEDEEYTEEGGEFEEAGEAPAPEAKKVDKAKMALDFYE